MPKQFDVWNEVKKVVDSKEVKVGFSIGQIWFMNMGENVGVEQGGKGKEFMRPVLVLRKFNKDMFWGVPLTSSERENAYRFSFCDSKNRQQKALLSQLRLFDTRRLTYQLGDCSTETLAQIINVLVQILQGEKYEENIKK